MKKRPQTFADRFGLLVKEFESRYRLSKASGVPESTLQQYAQARADLPPRADILFKLAPAANVSLEWRRARVRWGRPGCHPALDLRTSSWWKSATARRALCRTDHGHLPFSRVLLETRLGLSDDERLMALEADEDLDLTRFGRRCGAWFSVLV